MLRKIILSAIKVLVGFFIGLSALLYFFQGTFVYYPGKKYIGTPSDLQLEYEEVFLESANGNKICGWYVPCASAEYTVLFCHGNAGNISTRLKTIKIMHDLGYNFFIFDYQGYGKSEGSPTEEGTYADTRAALDHLLNDRKIPFDHVIFHARSLGGGVMTKIAVEKQPRIYILESTFTSVVDLAAHIYPYLPTKILTRIRYNSIDLLGKLSCPILFIHSPQDEVIPFSHGRKLFESYQGKKTFFQLQGGHNEGIYLCEKQYTEAIGAFLKEHLRN